MYLIPALWRAALRSVPLNSAPSARARRRWVALASLALCACGGGSSSNATAESQGQSVAYWAHRDSAPQAAPLLVTLQDAGPGATQRLASLGTMRALAAGTYVWGEGIASGLTWLAHPAAAHLPLVMMLCQRATSAASTALHAQAWVAQVAQTVQDPSALQGQSFGRSASECSEAQGNERYAVNGSGELIWTSPRGQQLVYSPQVLQALLSPQGWDNGLGQRRWLRAYRLPASVAQGSAMVLVEQMQDSGPGGSMQMVVWLP